MREGHGMMAENFSHIFARW